MMNMPKGDEAKESEIYIWFWMSLIYLLQIKFSNS